MISNITFYPGLQKAIDDLGLEKPTPVQAAAIPAALEGRDLLVCAQTGSGKTFAFLIPIVQTLSTTDVEKDSGTLALILTPTRELARQVFKQTEALIGSTPLHAVLLTGGDDFKYQRSLLRKNPEFVIATPGRLVELLDKGLVDLKKLNVLVLDEADRMLDMGFSEDMLRISGECSTARQTLMFSATLGHAGLDHLGSSLLNDPQTIDLTPLQADSQDIEHRILLADDRSHKEKLLAWVLNNVPFSRAMVFTNTRDNADRLGGLIRYHKHNAGVLHGEKEHSIRKNLMEQFSHGKMRVLVASDVAARGLDIKDVDLVINFDMPRRGDDYTHRVGRTGRAGNKGIAISLISPQEWDLMISIQRYLKLAMDRMHVKELAGTFNGPKKVKSSGKSVGSKKKKQTKKAAAKPAAKKKSARPKSGASTAGPLLTGNETLRRKKDGLKPD